MNLIIKKLNGLKKSQLKILCSKMNIKYSKKDKNKVIYELVKPLKISVKYRYRGGTPNRNKKKKKYLLLEELKNNWKTYSVEELKQFLEQLKKENYETMYMDNDVIQQTWKDNNSGILGTFFDTQIDEDDPKYKEYIKERQMINEIQNFISNQKDNEIQEKIDKLQDKNWKEAINRWKSVQQKLFYNEFKKIEEYNYNEGCDKMRMLERKMRDEMYNIFETSSWEILDTPITIPLVTCIQFSMPVNPFDEYKKKYPTIEKSNYFYNKKERRDEKISSDSDIWTKSGFDLSRENQFPYIKFHLYKEIIIKIKDCDNNQTIE